jgi:glycine reductase
MELKGKKVIALGERDGIQGDTIAKAAESAGAEVVLQVTHCFVWTSAGAIDLDGQEELKQTVEKVGKDDLVVLLGTPNAESSELYAVTLKDGDPSWAGALAGIQLELPVYHVTEEEIKNQINPELYADELEVAEMVLEVDEISESVKKVRES